MDSFGKWYMEYSSYLVSSHTLHIWTHSVKWCTEEKTNILMMFSNGKSHIRLVEIGGISDWISATKNNEL